jgi:tetratricopeptide (TPR) repeat protein
MPMKRPLTILVLLLLAHPAVAADKWLSIHSKNFQLIGNSSEAEVRRAGRVLEEFRTALEMMFPKMDQTSPVPVTVIVFKNDEAMKPYKPLYQGNPSNALAFFQPGEDVNYIVVTPLAQPSAILHEYVHFLLRQNVGSLPLWVTEGFAEAYSTFELGNKPNDFAIGRAPDRHVAMLNDPAAKFIPMKRFITIQQNSPEYNEDSKQGMFYAQSWAYVHYLILGAEGKRRTQFVQLLTALSRGEPFEDSFGDAFQTDYGTLEDEVRDYVRKRSSWPVMKVTGKEGLQIDVRAINTATLSEAESEFYLGDLLLHLNRTDDAEPHLAAAVAKAPTLSGAQSSLALLRVRQKKYDEALSLLKKAADADSKNPMINFYYAYVLDRADSDASASLAGNSADRYETMRTYAKRSMELAPKFIEGYALLARINLNAGEHLDEAENALKKGLQLAPGRDDMRMLLAQTYLREDRTADARGVLSIIERSTNDADLRKRATTMLDRTEQTFTFTEITAGIEKELEKERAAERAANPPPPPPASSPKETVIEALTPTAPAVEGEKVTGLLINLDCAAGLTLRVRTADRGTLEFHSAQPEKIQFLSYTADVANNINCGPRNPGTPVSITFRAQADGAREPLVVEFMQK